MAKESPTGTKEWATYTANLCVGCEHDCRYCYARHSALTRFKQIKTSDEWKSEKVTPKRGLPLKPDGGTIMFPTTHDITPNNVDACERFIVETLRNGNNMLIVSKPHLACTKQLLAALTPFKDKVLFRFTIGSYSDWVLSFWEPGAPNFTERYASLKEAHKSGYKTSVSAEPLLDDPMRLYQVLIPYITDSIWFGMMNKISQRVDRRNWGPDGDHHLALVEQLQTRVFIEDTYDLMCDLPKIKWKDSYKEVLGLKKPEDIGLDE